mgnify:FL=1|jgi:acyl-CoA thioesterase
MEKPSSSSIVDKMYKNDLFSKWLGIDIVEKGIGKSKLVMTIRQEMVNGFGIAHGGITYSLADSALAFACNSQGRESMSIETSISHTKPCHIGDVLTAEAIEESLSYKIAIYHISVKNQDNETVALFKGTVYRTNKNWEL